MTMTPIAETVKAMDFLSRRQAQETQKTLDPLSVNIVNRLFIFFEAICRGFEKQYANHPKKLNMEKIQWARGFMDSRITRLEQIELGIKRCRLESPVNTPRLGEFLKWCKPEPQDVGLPTLEEAYSLAVQINRQFSDYKPSCQKTYSVIRHILNQIGSMEFRSMKADKAFKMFERYYPIACMQFVEGRLQEIPKSIPEQPEPHPDDRKRSNEARLKAMEAIRKMGVPLVVRHE